MDTPPTAPPPRKRRAKRSSLHRTTVRWSDADYAALLAAADGTGLTVGSYIRLRALGAPTTRARHRAPVDLAALATVLRAFTKVAVNLNQVARHMNMGGIIMPDEVVVLAVRLDASRAQIMSVMGRP